ncbi:hypothetical protein F5888DRAFT_1699204 [Russula emetica]|nr:hypothetical protein F5888DRAFT_1699204 [Russula emetica]
MSCPHSYLKRPHAIIPTFATHLFLFASQAWAAPHSINLVRRDSSSSASKIAAPIIAALVFIIAIPMVFYRNELLSKLRRMSLPSMRVRQRPSPTSVRDLTAEEIAGTVATNQAQAASTARTNRRTGRNNRRTPSQISTRSLPAYMKEPGELELVIIQGSQDMEDAPLTAQVVMPSVREDEDESANSHSRGPSQASYVIVNDDPLAQTPLLERNDSNESNHERQNTHTSAGSVDISEARHADQFSPLLNTAEIPDPRGEAPPYFEVVGDLGDVRATSRDLSRVDTADTLPIAPDTLPTSDATSPPGRRRSMFRGLIDAASRALSSPHPTSPLPLSRPSRDMALSPSPRPSNLSSRQGGARSLLSGHRATPSQSGSVQSVTSSAFGRVVSRTHSRSVTNVTAGLTSPSAISIASISSPLMHTVVRTDFVYPRSGPTPEQLKLISSVESVSKFGVPYGPAAVAFASASLVNLHGPPPEFQEHPSTDGLPGPSVGETRARAGSALSRVSRDGNSPNSRISLSSLRESIVPSEPAARESESSSSHPNPETRPPVPDHNDDNASAPEPEYPEDKKEPEVETPIRTIPPRIPSPSPTVGTTSTAVTVTKATAAELGVVPEFPEGAAPNSHRPALPSFATETAPATATTRNASAPSSFRMPPTSQGRMHPGSRSSSMETFRTAASDPEQGPESDRGASDTEHETDAFTDAESGAETEVETLPVTPHVVHTESTVLAPEPPALSA